MPASRPAATYRLQLHAGFGFDRARALIPYLDRLGITHLYLSPVFTAVPGSAHGYDVTDPTSLNPELGTEGEFRALAEGARECGMGIVLDIVPNHMAASRHNPWWMDVLKHGEGSRYARTFDIDWRSQGGRVLLPVLGAPLADVLASGQLQVVREHGEPVVRYHEHRFPLARGTAERHRGRSRLGSLLDAQHYRLAFWRLASTEINYRRFFDISDLVSLRMDDPVVFEQTHALVFRLAAEGSIAGVRVDHVDGLLDPTAYLRRLAGRLRELTPGRDPFIVVEKILAPGESLPGEWPVAGTTGYEFMDSVGGVLTDGVGSARIDRAAAAFTGRAVEFHDLAAECKRLVLEELFGGQMDAQVAHLAELARVDRRDLPRRDLAIALAEAMARLRVYRTYTRERPARTEDRRRIEEALKDARRRLDDQFEPALAFIERVLLLADGPEGWLSYVRQWQRFTGPLTAKGVEDTALYRHAGLLSRAEVGADPGCPPGDVAAFHRTMSARARRSPGALSATSTHDTKTSEDVRARLAVLSEIPSAWEPRVARWHRWMLRAHRTVNGVDVPDPLEEWRIYQAVVGAWPLDRSEFRAFRERIERYVVKAAREAKAHTSWLDPDEDHEGALLRFVRALLSSRNTRWRADLEDLLGRIELPGAVNALAQTLIRITGPGIPDTYQGAELWYQALVDPDNRRPVDYNRRRATLAGLDGADPRDLLRDWRSGAIKLHLTREALRLRREHRELFERGRYVPLDVRGRRRAHVVAFARRLGSEWVVTAVPRQVARLTRAACPPVGPTWSGTTVALPRRAPKGFVEVLSARRVGATDGALRLSDAFAVLPVALLVSEG